MGRIKRYKWLLIVLTLCFAFGGVAYAGYNVAIIASSPSDQWRACVSNTGVVRADTMRLNSYPPSCPRSTDTIRSWNASGPSGVNGLNGTNGRDGSTGPSGPSGASGQSGATGATGPRATPSAVRIIKMQESYTNVGSEVSYGPVDVSDCRRISVHVTMNVPVSMLIRVYSLLSTTDTKAGLLSAGYGSLGSSGVVYFPPARPMMATKFTVTPGGWVSLPEAFIMCETQPVPNVAFPFQGWDEPRSPLSIGAGGTQAFQASVENCRDLGFLIGTPSASAGWGNLYSQVDNAGPIVGYMGGGTAEGVGGMVGFYPSSYLPVFIAHFTLNVYSSTDISSAWVVCAPFS